MSNPDRCCQLAIEVQAEFDRIGSDRCRYIRKIQADAIREAVQLAGSQTLNLSGIDYTETSILKRYANKLEAGEL